MQNLVSVLGTDFARWADLTEEYAAGLEALRRGEPGASAKMMEFARQMNRYSELVCDKAIPPRQHNKIKDSEGTSGGWLTSALQTMSVFH